MKKFLILTLIFQSLILCAQPGRYGAAGGGSQTAFISGTVVLSPETSGGEEIPGNGVVVQVISSLKDKKYCVAGEDGRFRLIGIKPGKAIVSFSMMGYETLEKVVDIVAGQNKIVANLKPKTETLEGAVVKEYVNPISVVGDTVIFKAAAVKTQKGEMAIDILEQMPGVEVTDTGIKVLNEEVKNVYIDGALLFGNAPMKALQNLAADDVTSIKSYQEYANKDPNHKIRKTEEKERVLDVQTKSKPKMVVNADLTAGGGFDTDSTYHQFRYTLGGSYSRFSEKLQYNLSANVNNINDASTWRRGASFDRGGTSSGSPDLRSITAEAKIRKRWMSPTTRNFELGSAMGSYSLSDSYNVSESITKLVYFPSDQFDSREVDKTNTSTTTSKTHNFTFKGSKSLKDGKISLKTDVSLEEVLKDARSTDTNRQDDLAPTGTRSSTYSENGSKSYTASLSFDKGIKDKVRISLGADFGLSDSDQGTARRDTLETTATHQVIDIDGIGKGSDFSVTPSVRYEFSDYCSLALKYVLSKTDRLSRQVAFDNTDPEDPVMDTVNTYTYTKANLTQKANLTLTKYVIPLKANLNATFGLRSTTLDKDETYPDPDTYNRTFNSMVSNVSFENQSSVDHWIFEFQTSADTPSIEQVRPKIDNSSLYSVSTGNPLLEQSNTYSFSGSLSSVVGSGRATVKEMEDEYGTQSDNFGRRGRRGFGGGNGPGRNNDYNTLYLSGGFSLTHNPIVRRQIYYTASTFLPEYNYTMPAQSTLSTYDNAPDGYKADATLMYSMQLKKIMCILNSSIGADWSSTPSYVNSELTRTVDFVPSARISLRSNFSRKIRILADTRSQYVSSSNDRGDFTDYFMEKIRVGWEVNSIFQHLYTSGTYNTTLTQGLEYGKMDGNILNLRIGARFGKNNNYDFSIAANDVFSDKTGFSTSMNSNYIKNSWSHQFGRYVLATFAYRFNKGGRGGRGTGGPGGGPGRF